jgi:hypothetical protein
MNPLLSKFILILLIFAFNTHSQLLSKKEFRLKESKPSYIDLAKSIEPVSKSSIASNKSLLLAGFLSFSVPGAALGQFYKEEFVNGAVRVGISAICILWFFLSPTFDYGGGGDATQKLIATCIYAVNWIASIIDAASPRKYQTYGKFRKYNVNF